MPYHSMIIAIDRLRL